MYQITNWQERYEVSSKGRDAKEGDELRAGPLQFIKLKVHGHSQGTGYRKLLKAAGPKSMEVFGIFCKFLEIAGNQPCDKRGMLLNEGDNPASVKDLAFILSIPEKQVKNAIKVLLELTWLNFDDNIILIQDNTIQLNTTQGAGNFRELPENVGNAGNADTELKTRQFKEVKGNGENITNGQKGKIVQLDRPNKDKNVQLNGQKKANYFVIGSKTKQFKETQKKGKNEKKRQENEIIFENSRKMYPGSKRGTKTEFKYLKNCHNDWEEVLPQLLPAIQQQVAWRESAKDGEFRPAWKNFKTWIFNRCWEEEMPIDQKKDGKIFTDADFAASERAIDKRDRLKREAEAQGNR